MGRTFFSNRRRLLRRLNSVRTALIVAGLAACSTETSDSGPTSPDVVPPATGYAAVQSIFTRSCAFSGCHSGPSPQEGLDLRASAVHLNTVGVASRQVPAMNRIEPGRPDASYLMHKLEGTAGAVGGIGTQMPLGGQLSTAQIDTVRDWVLSGAPNN